MSATEKVINVLAQARLDHVAALDTLCACKDHEADERARAEARAVEAAGGEEKNLGSNEAARARALTLALSADKDYQLAKQATRSAKYHVRYSRAVAMNAEDELHALVQLYGKPAL